MELLRLEVIARVVLVADAERHEVELLKSVNDFTLSCHRKHLEQRLLCLVATVLGSALTLRYPDVLVLLLNGVMHVAAHSLAALEQFPWAETSLNCEGFVELDKCLNPRIDEEVVAYCYLTGRREMVLMQHQVEDSTVEDNISMIADECVTFRSWLDTCVSKGVTSTAFAQDALQHGLDVTKLELQWRVDADKSQAYQTISHPAWHPRHKALQHPRELPVSKQTLDGSFHFASRKGTNFVESPLPAPPLGECFRLRITHGQSDINYEL